MTEPAPRVVVIDDHDLFRRGVIAAIGGCCEVVGEADDVGSGIEVINDLRPSVAIVDVHLTSGSGADVVDYFAADPEAPRFLALSVSDAPEDVIGIVRAGARGYVTKRIDAAELSESILQVHAGNAVFSPRLAGFVLDAYRSAPPMESSARSDLRGLDGTENVEKLSGRERQVMEYLARGYTYKEIAAALFISDRTVESHASAVLRKLQLSNRTELAHWATKNRLV